MNDPRVLMTTYPTAFLHRGGGELEFLDIQNNLRMLGIRADIYGPTSLQLGKYDVVLHYSVFPTGLEFVRSIREAGKRLILLPSLWIGKAPDPATKSSMSEFFALADRVVFKSRSEFENVSAFIPVDGAKVAYCPWGIDSCFAEPIDPTLFATEYRLTEYVLWMGIIEEVKNQLTAIHALKNFPLPVVFLGDYRDRSYYESCVRAAPPHFKFVSHIAPKSELLRSAIRGAKAYLEVPLEPPGFSALEAAMAGIPLVLSDGTWSREHFGDLVTYADPRSHSSILQALDRALKQGPAAGLQMQVRNRHMLPQCLEPLARLLRNR